MEPYNLVAAAVINRAVKDYKRALRKNDQHKIKELEKFFLSAYGQLFSYGHGELIIERCKKSVEKYLQKIRKKD